MPPFYNREWFHLAFGVFLPKCYPSLLARTAGTHGFKLRKCVGKRCWLVYTRGMCNISVLSSTIFFGCAHCQLTNSTIGLFCEWFNKFNCVVATGRILRRLSVLNEPNGLWICKSLVLLHGRQRPAKHKLEDGINTKPQSSLCHWNFT